MFLDVNERVEMLVVFKLDRVVPMEMKWNKNTYHIQNINMVHQVMDGDTRVYIYSISDSVNSFKVAFNTKSLHWMLEQVYYES